MKTIISLILTSLILSCCFCQSHWSGPLNITSPIYRTGRVGIGISSPSQKFQLKGGNMLLDEAILGTTGNLYFGGLTTAFQPGMRLSYQNSKQAYFDVTTSQLNQGLVFRVDNLNGITERLRINNNGNIGINEPNPAFKLHVQGNGHFSDKLQVGGSGWIPAQLSAISPGNWAAISAIALLSENGIYTEGKKTGLLGFGGYHSSGTPNPQETFGVWGASGSFATYRSVGVHGDGLGSQYSIGVWGQAMGGSVINYGVWGDLPAGNGYAGYFSGDVYTTASYLPSDSKIKSDLTAFNGGLDILNKINVYNFKFKTKEFQSLRLSDKKQIGFIAEEIETILPDIIKLAIQPTELDSTGAVINESVSIKSVNYTAIIPILVQAIKEQQKEIDYLKQEMIAINNKKKK